MNGEASLPFTDQTTRMVPIHIVKRYCPNKKQLGVMSQLTWRPMPSGFGVGHVAASGRSRRSQDGGLKPEIDGTDEWDVVFGGDTLAPCRLKESAA